MTCGYGTNYITAVVFKILALTLRLGVTCSATIPTFGSDW